MSPVGVALTFVGLWLLVGLGIFFAATGARGLLATRLAVRAQARSGESHGQLSAGADAGVQLVGLAFSLAVTLVGLALAFGGLLLLVRFFVH